MDTDRLPGCYRHPDRGTGIRCTRCERPICPECMISASVGFQCPECVREGSGTGHRPTANAPRTVAGGVVAADPHLVTKILIGVNVAVFFATLLARPSPSPWNCSAATSTTGADRSTASPTASTTAC